MGLYPPGYDGRKLARIWLRIPMPTGGEVQGPGSTASVWLIELAIPEGLSAELGALIKRQETFRMQRGDAPAVAAVCEVREVTRAEIEAGAHPLRVLAWHWEEASVESFGRPAA